MNFIDLETQQRRIRCQIDAKIADVLSHGQYILGPENRQLEAELAEFVGVEHVLGVSSGTDALLIALMALGIGPGDEVITVPYTWISSAEVIALAGATPVFVDVEEDTWNMNPSLLEAAITERTKAIMPVGIYGQMADLTAINAVAEKHGGIPVVEDAAQCFGATHHGKQACSMTAIGCTSFFPSKPLGGYGDGGAVFTNDAELADTMRQIHIHGQKEKHHHPILGLNGRMDTLQSAILLPKLEIYPEEIQMRQAVADRYAAGLAGLSGISLPQIRSGNTSVWAQYTILCEDRDAVQSTLSADNIPSVPYYAVPVHLQPVFDGLGYKAGDFPLTEAVADKCLSLPMSPYLSEEDQTRVIEALAS